MPYEYQNISEIDAANGQVQANAYTSQDLELMDGVYGYLRNPEFSKSPYDRVEFHVYDINQTRIFSDHNIRDWSISSDIDREPQVELSINEHLKAAGLTSGVFNTIYNFHRDAVGKPVGPKFKIHSISANRTEVRIIPTVSEESELDQGSELEGFYARFQSLRASSGIQAPYNVSAIPNSPLWTQLQINFGFNRIYAIASWLIDDIFPADPVFPKTILLKLYEPLPTNLKTKQVGWLVAPATQPIINKVLIDAPVDISYSSIAGPNFDLSIDGASGVQTGYKSRDDILGKDSDLQSEILNSYSSSADGIRLNIDYAIFENYVHFSSAKQRVDNFIYKLKQINHFDISARKFDYSEYPTSDIYIYEYTGSHGSKYAKQYQKSWVDKKVKLINEFDDFEKWLYFESGSQDKFITTSGSNGGGEYDWSRSAITPFPKLSGSYKNDLWTEDYLDWNNDQIFDWAVHSIFMPGPNYELLNRRSSKATIWYNAAEASSSAYDKQNNNLLTKTVPEFISDTGKDNNNTYLRFLNLTGQAHDMWWSYTNNFTKNSQRVHNSDFANKIGLSDDIIYHIGKSYGANLVEGDTNQQLWYYQLGKTEYGKRHQNSPTASIKTLSTKQRTAEVWKRLVNNLPFLLKAKGTAAGVRGLINCYGIPEHILPIYEYGSSNKSSQKTLFEQPNFKYSLNFNQSQSVRTNWGPHQKTYHVTSSAITPNAVEFRVWPYNKATIISQSLWQVGNKMGIVLERSSSNTRIKGKTEGFTEYGSFKLAISGSATYNDGNGFGYSTVSTGKAKIFESSNEAESGNGWWTVVLNRHASATPQTRGAYHSSSKFVYSLTAMRGGYGVIDQAVSCSLRVSGSTSYSSSLNDSWSGSLEHSDSHYAYFGGYITHSLGTKYSGFQNHNVFGKPFTGSMQEGRYYLKPISSSTQSDHTLAPEMYSSNAGEKTYDDLAVRLQFNNPKNHYSGSAPKGINETTSSKFIEDTQPDQTYKGRFWDSNFLYPVSGSTQNFDDKLYYGSTQEISYTDTPELGPNNYTSNKIRREENKLSRHLSAEARAELPTSEKYALDSNNVGIYFSPTDQVNKDIFNHLGGTLLDDYIGDARNAYEDTYDELKRFNRLYWKKYTKENNKSDYLNELKLYDMSLFTMIKRYLPARVNADLGVIIEPHFIERSKAASRGKLSISGDTKVQNIAIDASSFIKAPAPTRISRTEPEVPRTGVVIEPQTITGKIGAPNKPPAKIHIKTIGLNSLAKSFTGAPQQHTPTSNTQTPLSLTIDGIVTATDNTSIYTLSSQQAKSVQKGVQVKTQHNASNVISHATKSPLEGTLITTKQVNSSVYIHKNLILSKSFTITGTTVYSASTYIPAYTPGWKTSGSLLHICAYRKSETRSTNEYHYYSASLEYTTGVEGGAPSDSDGVPTNKAKLVHAQQSASKGKSYEDGGSVNPYAYRKSLKKAEVSDYNLGGTTGLYKMRYDGAQLKGADFNINSKHTPDNGPVVSFTIGDPNTLVSSDAGFGGNISIA